MVGYVAALAVDQLSGVGLLDQQNSFLGKLLLHVCVFGILLIRWGRGARAPRVCTLLLLHGGVFSIPPVWWAHRRRGFAGPRPALRVAGPVVRAMLSSWLLHTACGHPLQGCGFPHATPQLCSLAVRSAPWTMPLSPPDAHTHSLFYL